ncbi:4-hydroxyphenylacetate 3-monooxygenase, oxygenase component [Litchfieldia alkalitelluris]|uniref:4-hydroxyphenylacetate 3-monooxygenase, oxygenase component n=1 Tax=Litchfieldia alkalitelluris TaxID=304268 RepID=UPI00099607B4|nr:4-hydroxyphenylacetate 3-monooxygenase, oxygenase component [Litchfieldia alkalitelluris]
MPAINGEEYVKRIDKLNSEVWIEGKRLQGKISEHPAFQGVIQSQARLYDLQHQSDKLDVMTFVLPESGNRVGTSYLNPKTKDDLIKRRMMIQEWAEAHLGLMGRSPDYMNTALMAISAGADVFECENEDFSKNIRSFYQEACENDYSFTHTFINPQVNRSKYYFEELNESIVSAQVIEKNEKGIVIHGARLLATQGGITDEIIVFPAGGENLAKEFAYAFSIPSNTKGLKFICRESFSYKDSNFDHPLGSRFEEMDTIIVFNKVQVPWERVFFYNSPELAKKMYSETSFFPLVLHQVVSRQITKTETILGVAQSLVDIINIGEYQHVQEKISEIITGYESLKGLMYSAELQAKIDQFGTMVPSLQPLYAAINLYPKLYPRFIEIIQLLGASGLVSIPTKADLESSVGKDLESYLQAAAANAEDRVKFYRLAWDLSLSAFGGRQTLYERFFFGDPIKLASNQYRGYERSELVQRVWNFLNIE